MPRLKNKIAIVDIETTGPNIDEGDRIIQIGAIIISEGNIVNTYSMLINPNREIPDHIAKLTGIKEEDVVNAPQFNSVATLWHERLKDCVFIAHNLGFDLRILKESFERFDLDFNPVALDSVVLAKIIVPTAIGFNLTDLSRHFNLEYSEAHDAYSDALITVDIVSELAKIAKKIPIETLSRMEPFLRNLRYNEIEFFTNPDKFILNEIVSVKRTKVNLEGENLPKQNLTLSEFINEKWQNHPFAVLEDTHRPIPYDVIFNETILKEGRHLLSFPTLDESNYWNDLIVNHTSLEKIALLKSQGNYLHEKAFENYILQYNFKRNNQQELLVIAASIHWQSFSKFGDFSEINKELSIKNLLSKHQTKDLLVKNHSNFHQVIEYAKKANIIITYDANLHSMMLKNRDQIEYLFSRKLIIGNVNSFIDSARFIQQRNIELSDLNNQLLNLFDDIQQVYSD
ncbi:MAG: 3'-5' exonuclease, partial [Ruoffia tabacinasalis]